MEQLWAHVDETNHTGNINKIDGKISLHNMQVSLSLSLSLFVDGFDKNFGKQLFSIRSTSGVVQHHN
jgi:hypothetical protein